MTDDVTEMPRTVDVLRAGIERGLQFGVQIYVSLRGRVLLDAGFGDARPGVPMTRETVSLWLSAGKPLTAVAVMKLVEREVLALDLPVADVIPEFASGGKESICVRHLLTHTGGFRDAAVNWSQLNWDDNIAAVCATPLEPNWVVGQTAGYHVASSWYVLGEIIRRVSGIHPSDFLRTEIFEPLGMTSSWNGMPGAIWHQYGDRIGMLWQRERGDLRPLDWHDETHCAGCSPGGNSRGPVRELGRFYECLLAGGEIDGQRLLTTASVAEMTRPQRVGLFDLTLQHIMDFGLGFMLDSKRYGMKTVPYGFGSGCSERAFGHGGSQSSIGFADPEHGLVVAYVANIRPGEPHHQRRHREIVDAIWNDIRARMESEASR